MEVRVLSCADSQLKWFRETEATFSQAQSAFFATVSNVRRKDGQKWNKDASEGASSAPDAQQNRCAGPRK